MTTDEEMAFIIDQAYVEWSNRPSPNDYIPPMSFGQFVTKRLNNNSKPCGALAPFTITTPQHPTHRPACTAKGHRHGHSINLDNETIITWGEPQQPKKD